MVGQTPKISAAELTDPDALRLLGKGTGPSREDGERILVLIPLSTFQTLFLFLFFFILSSSPLLCFLSHWQAVFKVLAALEVVVQGQTKEVKRTIPGRMTLKPKDVFTLLGPPDRPGAGMLADANTAPGYGQSSQSSQGG